MFLRAGTLPGRERDAVHQRQGTNAHALKKDKTPHFLYLSFHPFAGCRKLATSCKWQIAKSHQLI
jgi:hypothetical protein